MKQAYLDLFEKFPKAEINKPLASLCSFGVGGPADLYYRLSDTSEIGGLISKTEELNIPYIILGGGTNIIFDDAGFRGIIIHIMARKVAIEPSDNPKKGIISAEAGALTSQIIAFALKNNLSGMEKLTGLPGTIGGAVRGNAGAFGTEIKDLFHKALLYTHNKKLKEAGREYFDFSYRHSKVKASGDVIIKVFLELEAKDCTQAMVEATEIIKNRLIKQPKGRSTGSFFKNPNTDLKAGHLLDQCGCKGLQVGGAQVSHEHANWIINRGNATQKDALELARIMREKVRSRFDITLEPEVQLVGLMGFILL